MGQKTNSSAFRSGIINLWKFDSNVYDSANSNNFSLYSYFLIRNKLKKYKSKIVHFKSIYGSQVYFFITLYKFLKRVQKKLKWWERKKFFERKLKTKVKSKTRLPKEIIKLRLKMKKFKEKNYIFLRFLMKKKSKVFRKFYLSKIKKIYILSKINLLSHLKNHNRLIAKKKLKQMKTVLKICKPFIYKTSHKFYLVKLNKLLRFKKHEKFWKVALNFKYKTSKVSLTQKGISLTNSDDIQKKRILLNHSLVSKIRVTKSQTKNLLKFIKLKIKLQKELEALLKRSVTLKLQNVFWKLPQDFLLKIKTLKSTFGRFQWFRALKDLINIISVSSYFFTPELFSDFIAAELEDNLNQKSVIKVLSFSLKNGFPLLGLLKGVKFIIWGKVDKAKRTRKFISKWGNINTTNLKFNSEEALTHCFTKYGVFGVRVLFTK